MSASPDFLLVGNSLAVDFVNTELITGERRLDLLRSDADLMRWADAAGLRLESGILSRVDHDRLERRTRPLRRALRALFVAVTGSARPDPANIRLVNDVLRTSRTVAPLSYRNGAFERMPDTVKQPTDVLRTIAEDACRILTGRESGLLRSCAGQRCILFFIDRSRTSARRWCSMELCGNRAKVAAHHRRSRA